jgi:hypothetical protein
MTGLGRFSPQIGRKPAPKKADFGVAEEADFLLPLKNPGRFSISSFPHLNAGLRLGLLVVHKLNPRFFSISRQIFFYTYTYMYGNQGRVLLLRDQ